MKEQALSKLIKRLLDKRFPDSGIKDVVVSISDLGDNMTFTSVYLITEAPYLPEKSDEILKYVRELSKYMGLQTNVVSFASES